MTFDEAFARAGLRAGLYNTLIAVLTAVTIVLGMRLMGAMLISSLVIFPALTICVFINPFSGSPCARAGQPDQLLIGMSLSCLLSTPAGASGAGQLAMFCCFPWQTLKNRMR